MVKYVFTGISATWAEREFGIELDGARCTRAVWVDNVFLFAQRPERLETMVQELSRAQPGP